MEPSREGGERLRSILILYHYKHEYPMRATIRDHLYSFRRYSGHRCYYLNLGVRGIPSYLRHVRFDIIVFHTTFISQHFSRPAFANLMDRTRFLAQWSGVKVALPQDEFINTDMLCDFVNQFGIEHVFSVAPPSEWPKIYSGVDLRRVTFHSVLTGYLDESTVTRIEQLAEGVRSRPVDIGYRAYRATPWLGRHGLLKTEVAERFLEAAPAQGLTLDISTRPQDTLLGDDWYRFMLRCKYFIGVEGGSSILDRDGTIRERTEAYLARHPGAGFAEVERHCFPGQEGSLGLRAISPRHLEACATRTCQVLIEGDYNGILRPAEHYIELKRDFSNLGQVLELVRQDALREAIVERAYRDVVGSGQYTYRGFVSSVLGAALGDGSTAVSASHRDAVLCGWLRLADAFCWIRVAVRCKVSVPAKRVTRPVKRALRRALLAVVPTWLLERLRLLRRALVCR